MKAKDGAIRAVSHEDQSSVTTSAETIFCAYPEKSLALIQINVLHITKKAFFHEDGNGNIYDEDGKDNTMLEMEVDDEMYPIENITDYSQYHDLKPPEKMNIIKKEDVQDKAFVNGNDGSQKNGRGSYKHFKDTEKKQLFLSCVRERYDSPSCRVATPHQPSYGTELG